MSSGSLSNAHPMKSQGRKGFLWTPKRRGAADLPVFIRRQKPLPSPAPAEQKRAGPPGPASAGKLRRLQDAFARAGWARAMAAGGADRLWGTSAPERDALGSRWSTFPPPPLLPSCSASAASPPSLAHLAHRNLPDPLPSSFLPLSLSLPGSQGGLPGSVSGIHLQREEGKS